MAGVEIVTVQLKVVWVAGEFPGNHSNHGNRTNRSNHSNCGKLEWVD
jgi:hypothetical protein